MKRLLLVSAVALVGCGPLDGVWLGVLEVGAGDGPEMTYSASLTVESLPDRVSGLCPNGDGEVTLEHGGWWNGALDCGGVSFQSVQLGELPDGRLFVAGKAEATGDAGTFAFTGERR